jgi:hypothetical protein
MFEEPYFSLHSSAISRERSIFPDDTMTGDDDDYRVAVIRPTDSSYRFWVACERRLFLIAPCLSVGDRCERLPRFLLEIGTMWCERYVELLSSSGEIFGEFLLYLSENMVSFFSFRRNPFFLYSWGYTSFFLIR